MLNTKIVKIKISKSIKIKYYESLGYKINGDYICVDIKDIPKGSHLLVEAKCDYCGFIKNISYKEYNRNISFNGKFSCSNKCGCIKKKELSIIKYGVDSPSKLENIKRKNIKTNLEKYGVEYYMSTEDFKIKSKKTNLEKYGVENVMFSEEVKNMLLNTNLKKYGVKNVFQSENIKYKAKQKNLEKYGFEHYSSTLEYKEKYKNTCLEKYGVNYPTQSELIMLKIINSNLEKYGVEYYMSTEDFKIKSKKTNLEKYGSEYPLKSEIVRVNKVNCKDINYINYVGDNISLYKCSNGHEFTISSDNYHSRIKNNTQLCTFCNAIGDSKSIKEKELFDYIQSIYNNKIVPSYRDGLEIDIYLPDLKIGFEFNGLYWHSEEYKDKKYHINKTNYFNEKGIRIIHIWEDDWDFKKDIIKSQIRNWLNLNTEKIFARKCEIKEINDIKIIREFLDKNHIQGYTHSIKKIGLFYEGELVSLMTFDKFEGRKKMKEGEWNLSRFCNKLNFSIVGGSSKILKYFIKKYNPTRIISYADRDWSNGNLYEKIGFKLKSQTECDYKYVIDNRRVNKSRYRKSRLNTKLSESNFMNMSGFYKIYDCGKLKFEILFHI